MNKKLISDKLVLEQLSNNGDRKLCKWNKGDILCRLIQVLLIGFSDMGVYQFVNALFQTEKVQLAKGSLRGSSYTSLKTREIIEIKGWGIRRR